MDSDRETIALLTPTVISRLSLHDALEKLEALARLAQQWAKRREALNAYLFSGDRSEVPAEAWRLDQKISADRELFLRLKSALSRQVSKQQRSERWRARRENAKREEKERKKKLMHFADALSDTPERYRITRSLIGETAFSNLLSQESQQEADVCLHLNRYELIQRVCEHG